MTTPERLQVTVWSYARDDLETLSMGLFDANGAPYKGDAVTLDRRECIVPRFASGETNPSILTFHDCDIHRLVIVRWERDNFNDAHKYLEAKS